MSSLHKCLAKATSGTPLNRNQWSFLLHHCMHDSGETRSPAKSVAAFICPLDLINWNTLFFFFSVLAHFLFQSSWMFLLSVSSWIQGLSEAGMMLSTFPMFHHVFSRTVPCKPHRPGGGACPSRLLFIPPLSFSASLVAQR